MSKEHTHTHTHTHTATHTQTHGAQTASAGQPFRGWHSFHRCGNLGMHFQLTKIIAESWLAQVSLTRKANTTSSLKPKRIHSHWYNQTVHNHAELAPPSKPCLQQSSHLTPKHLAKQRTSVSHQHRLQHAEPDWQGQEDRRGLHPGQQEWHERTSTVVIPPLLQKGRGVCYTAPSKQVSVYISLPYGMQCCRALKVRF
jgi:hypothetical protein